MPDLHIPLKHDKEGQNVVISGHALFTACGLIIPCKTKAGPTQMLGENLSDSSTSVVSARRESLPCEIVSHSLGQITIAPPGSVTLPRLLLNALADRRGNFHSFFDRCLLKFLLFWGTVTNSSNIVCTADIQNVYVELKYFAGRFSPFPFTLFRDFKGKPFVLCLGGSQNTLEQLSGCGELTFEKIFQ